jgi:SAM-dependent methyltransferase
MPQKRRPKRKKPRLTAANSDKLRLYELAVQSPESEVDFLMRTFRRLRSRPPRRIREDFCGTAFFASEWARTHKDNSVVGLDLHKPTLAWGRKHNVAALPEEARGRVKLLSRNVLHPGPGTGAMDAILAMNFSYWVFKTRPLMLRYFQAVYQSLKRDGVFYLDHYGGYEAQRVQAERRRCIGFTYVWDQAFFDPISYDIRCHIHFDFKRGPGLKRAFTYDWRLWTLPELRELLEEAGFRRSTIYWEGDNGNGGGNSIFRPRKVGESCATFIAYIVAEK